MAEQRFTKAFQEAFWKTHGKACMDCRLSVSFQAMRIDHVIPESILKRPGDFDVLRIRLGLDPNFQVLGHENLALLCDPCNSAKGDLILPDGVLGTRLAKISARLENLRKEIENGAKARDLDSTLRHIVRSIEKKRYTREQLLNGLDAVVSTEFLTINCAVSLEEDPGVVWSATATEQLQAMAIDGNLVVMELLAGLRAGSSRIQRLREGNGAYVLRVGRNLRAIFATTDTGTVILNIWRKASHTSG